MIRRDFQASFRFGNWMAQGRNWRSKRHRLLLGQFVGNLAQNRPRPLLLLLVLLLHLYEFRWLFISSAELQTESFVFPMRLGEQRDTSRSFRNGRPPWTGGHLLPGYRFPAHESV